MAAVVDQVDFGVFGVAGELIAVHHLADQGPAVAVMEGCQLVVTALPAMAEF